MCFRDRRCFRLDSGLQLKHWMPVEEKEDIYRYCLYNRPIEEIPAYTNEEYEAFLKGSSCCVSDCRSL